MDDRAFLRYLNVPNQKRDTKTIGVPSQPVALNDSNYLGVVVNMSLNTKDGDDRSLGRPSPSFASSD